MHQAAAYGRCVAATTSGRQELRKDLCSKEFGALKTCFINAVSDCREPSVPRGLSGHHKRLFIACRRGKKANEREASLDVRGREFESPRFQSEASSFTTAALESVNN